MNFGSEHVYWREPSDDESSEEEEELKEKGDGVSAAAAPAPSRGILKKSGQRRRGGGQMVKWMSLQLGDHKYTLRKYQPTLVELISLPDLIPYLNSHGLLDDEENQLLLDNTLPHKERVLHLLSYFEKKGPLDYLTFLQAMDTEPHHEGHAKLVRMLTRAASMSGDEPHRSVPRARVSQADTNVLAVKFDKLVSPSDVHTGDPVICSNANCQAFFSHLSKISDDHVVWVCEFCGNQNTVDLAPEEIPTVEDTTYLKAPAPTPAASSQESEVMGGLEDSLVVFCVDVSGSMCQTVEVEGRVEFKGHDRLRRLSEEMDVDIAHQFLPRQRTDVTYVSRLQSVQAAVDQQLTKLSHTQPNKRAAIITFSDEVRVIGDGRSEEVTIAGDRLSNVDELMGLAATLALPTSVRKSVRGLSKKVFELEEKGQTALGPALLLSVLLAGQLPGSKVIICTDGLANKGVGSLDDMKSDDALTEGQQFYSDLGDIAVSRGVTVSLVTIKGTQCRVLELGRVAERTGGEVTAVDPTSLDKEFGNILAKPIIATAVVAKIVLHGRLFFRTENFDGSVLEVPVGNVTPDTEVSFEYGVRSRKTTAQDLPPLVTGGKPYLPFQLQVEYTAGNGARLVRVISKTKPITEDRVLAEKDVDFGVIGSHAIRCSASLASEGKIAEARQSTIEAEKILRRSSGENPEKRSKYQKVMSSLAPLQHSLSRHAASLPLHHSSSATRESGPVPPKLPSVSLKKSFDEAEIIGSFGHRHSSIPVHSSSFGRHSSSTLGALSVTEPEFQRVSQRGMEDSLATELFHRMSESSSSLMRDRPVPPPVVKPTPLPRKSRPPPPIQEELSQEQPPRPPPPIQEHLSQEQPPSQGAESDD